MRKINITIILLFFSINFLGQTPLKESEIIGKWKVINTEVLIKNTTGNEKNIDLVKKGFTNTIFHFNGNGIFNIKFNSKAPDFFKELETMNNVNWLYLKQKKSILIGTKKDNYSEMEIFPEKRNNGFFFNIIGLVLEMEKISSEEKTSYIEIEKKVEKVENNIQKEFLITENLKDSEIIDFEKVEITPYFSTCKSKKEDDQKKCFRKELFRHFGMKFNADLPNKLGLAPGIHKIQNSFIINIHGEIVNIQTSGAKEELNDEAKRVLSLLPKINPGKHKGEIINVKFEFPFSLKVE